MGFEPAINLVTRCSPSRIVGSRGADEPTSAEPPLAATLVLPKANIEPVAATESCDRNSLRPTLRTLLVSEPILLS